MSAIARSLCSWSPTGLYVQKTHQIVSSIRSTRPGGSGSAVDMQNVFAGQLKGAIGNRARRDGNSLVSQLNEKLGLQ